MLQRLDSATVVGGLSSQALPFASTAAEDDADASFFSSPQLRVEASGADFPASPLLPSAASKVARSPSTRRSLGAKAPRQKAARSASAAGAEGDGAAGDDAFADAMETMRRSATVLTQQAKEGGAPSPQKRRRGQARRAESAGESSSALASSSAAPTEAEAFPPIVPFVVSSGPLSLAFARRGSGGGAASAHHASGGGGGGAAGRENSIGLSPFDPSAPSSAASAAACVPPLRSHASLGGLSSAAFRTSVGDPFSPIADNAERSGAVAGSGGGGGASYRYRCADGGGGAPSDANEGDGGATCVGAAPPAGRVLFGGASACTADDSDADDDATAIGDLCRKAAVGPASVSRALRPPPPLQPHVMSSGTASPPLRPRPAAALLEAVETLKSRDTSHTGMGRPISDRAASPAPPQPSSVISGGGIPNNSSGRSPSASPARSRASSLARGVASFFTSAARSVSALLQTTGPLASPSEGAVTHAVLQLDLSPSEPLALPNATPVPTNVPAPSLSQTTLGGSRGQSQWDTSMPTTPAAQTAAQRGDVASWSDGTADERAPRPAPTAAAIVSSPPPPPPPLPSQPLPPHEPMSGGLFGASLVGAMVRRASSLRARARSGSSVATPPPPSSLSTGEASLSSVALHRGGTEEGVSAAWRDVAAVHQRPSLSSMARTASLTAGPATSPPPTAETPVAAEEDEDDVPLAALRIRRGNTLTIDRRRSRSAAGGGLSLGMAADSSVLVSIPTGVIGVDGLDEGALAGSPSSPLSAIRRAASAAAMSHQHSPTDSATHPPTSPAARHASHHADVNGFDFDAATDNGLEGGGVVFGAEATGMGLMARALSRVGSLAAALVAPSASRHQSLSSAKDFKDLCPAEDSDNNVTSAAPTARRLAHFSGSEVDSDGPDEAPPPPVASIGARGRPPSAALSDAAGEAGAISAADGRALEEGDVASPPTTSAVPPPSPSPKQRRDAPVAGARGSRRVGAKARRDDAPPEEEAAALEEPQRPSQAAAADVPTARRSGRLRRSAEEKEEEAVALPSSLPPILSKKGAPAKGRAGGGVGGASTKTAEAAVGGGGERGGEGGLPFDYEAELLWLRAAAEAAFEALPQEVKEERFDDSAVPSADAEHLLTDATTAGGGGGGAPLPAGVEASSVSPLTADAAAAVLRPTAPLYRRLQHSLQRFAALAALEEEARVSLLSALLLSGGGGGGGGGGGVADDGSRAGDDPLSARSTPPPPPPSPAVGTAHVDAPLVGIDSAAFHRTVGVEGCRAVALVVETLLKSRARRVHAALLQTHLYFTLEAMRYAYPALGAPSLALGGPAGGAAFPPLPRRRLLLHRCVPLVIPNSLADDAGRADALETLLGVLAAPCDEVSFVGLSSHTARLHARVAESVVTSRFLAQLAAVLRSLAPISTVSVACACVANGGAASTAPKKIGAPTQGEASCVECAECARGPVFVAAVASPSLSSTSALPAPLPLLPPLDASSGLPSRHAQLAAPIAAGTADDEKEMASEHTRNSPSPNAVAQQLWRALHEAVDALLSHHPSAAAAAHAVRSEGIVPLLCRGLTAAYAEYPHRCAPHGAGRKEDSSLPCGHALPMKHDGVCGSNTSNVSSSAAAVPSVRLCASLVRRIAQSSGPMAKALLSGVAAMGPAAWEYLLRPLFEGPRGGPPDAAVQQELLEAVYCLATDTEGGAAVRRQLLQCSACSSGDAAQQRSNDGAPEGARGAAAKGRNTQRGAGAGSPPRNLAPAAGRRSGATTAPNNPSGVRAAVTGVTTSCGGLCAACATLLPAALVARGVASGAHPAALLGVAACLLEPGRFAAAVSASSGSLRDGGACGYGGFHRGALFAVCGRLTAVAVPSAEEQEGNGNAAPDAARRATIGRVRQSADAILYMCRYVLAVARIDAALLMLNACASAAGRPLCLQANDSELSARGRFCACPQPCGRVVSLAAALVAPLTIIGAHARRGSQLSARVTEVLAALADVETA